MPPFTQNGERAQSMLLVEVGLSAVRTSTLDIISRALCMAVCGNFRCVVQYFFGALDDEELLIIEGSCQLDRDALSAKGSHLVNPRQQQQHSAVIFALVVDFCRGFLRLGALSGATWSKRERFSPISQSLCVI